MSLPSCVLSAAPPDAVHRKAVGAALAGLMLLFAPAAWGQDLDYGKYENLFDEPVTASATGKPERVSDTPVLMDVITASDIARSGSRDVATLLRRVAGVDLVHASSGSPQVAIGSYPQTIGNQVVVLLNGRQIYFDGFGDLFWSALPVELEEIRQIEVIRGPQCALYGFNAVDGVVNIVTFDPVYDPVNNATARMGNHGRYDFSGSTTQSLGDGAGLRLTAAFDHATDYGMSHLWSGSNTLAKDPLRRSASLDGGVDLDDGSRLSLEVSHTDISEREAAYTFSYDARVISNSLKAGYIGDTAIGRINASVAASHLMIPTFVTAFFPSQSVTDRSIVGQVSDILKTGPNDSVRLGLEAHHDGLDGGALTLGTLSEDLGSGSAMWEHAFSPDLAVVNAVRYDFSQFGRSGPAPDLSATGNQNFDRSVSGFSTNSAAIQRIGDDDSLRLSFARGLQLPSLANFGQQTPNTPTAFDRFGNPNPRIAGAGGSRAAPYVEPAVVYDYQAGWDHLFREWAITARVSAFHQMILRQLGSPFAILNGAIVQRRAETNGAVADGTTVSLGHRAKTGWTWGVNYWYESISDHAHHRLQETLPEHQANATVGYAWGDWDADLALQYGSPSVGTTLTYQNRRPRLVSNALDAYYTLAPRIAWHANETVTFELTADNLWPYRDSITQREEATYMLSVHVSY
jgi:iron complex outermembrane receptor protein